MALLPPPLSRALLFFVEKNVVANFDSNDQLIYFSILEYLISRKARSCTEMGLLLFFSPTHALLTNAI